MINHFRTFVTLLLAFLFARHVDSLGDTDTITWGGDNGRSGYQTTVIHRDELLNALSLDVTSDPE
ncbi:unnamed protein product [Aureobasidium pullulans]|nr:unnamed protein product [Aureobasidium pullulans]